MWENSVVILAWLLIGWLPTRLLKGCWYFAIGAIDWKQQRDWIFAITLCGPVGALIALWVWIDVYKAKLVWKW